MKTRSKKLLMWPLAIVTMLVTLSSCADDFNEYATSTSDTHVCVYDGSERGGQKLKFQIPPGAEAKKIDGNDQVVRIPASNRFWAVSTVDSVRDPGAPTHYTGNAAGGVPVFVEGQIRFRFNLERACEWYSKHGRRNADENGSLGFNVRDDANQGWFRFGNENFVPTMQEIINEQLQPYNWASMHFNYPMNANPENGLIPDGAEPGTATRSDLGITLGEGYTARLNANLGVASDEDGFFCGIDPDSSGGSTSCPTIRFQVTYAGPCATDPQVAPCEDSKVKARQKLEDTKAQLVAAQEEGKLRAEQQTQLIAAEKAKAELLVEQAKVAALQAQIDNAKCAELAGLGLDCEGKHPNYVLNNGG